MKNSEKQYLGIELGSTRIKAVLINGDGEVLNSGSHTWENELKDGLWTYSERNIHEGFADCVRDLVRHNGGVPDIAALGVSAMMHGYIALDRDGRLLAPFLTWRNTNAHRAADALTALFGVNVPMRWSIAQLYEAILNGEPHVKDIAHITTLSGYIHYRLTGRHVLGIGDASGMFPIDSSVRDYDPALLERFDALVADRGYPWKIRDILPTVLCAGEDAGCLTPAGVDFMGAAFPVGLPMAPPEGDAGTGMVATNSIKVGTGNISAGTSIFAMVVMDKALSRLHTEIDPVTTPDGKPVAMVHCNNCTSDINAWADLLGEFAATLGVELTTPQVLSAMFTASETADGALSDLLNYNFISGEPIVGLEKGMPLFLRKPDGKLSFAAFSRAQIYSCMAGIAVGMDILYEEGVKVQEVYGHGGFFKTPQVGQRAMSAAIGATVSVMETAGEGGAWGMALLTALADSGLTLEDYLTAVFSTQAVHSLSATPQQREEFLRYLEDYKKGLSAAGEAVKHLCGLTI